MQREVARRFPEARVTFCVGVLAIIVGGLAVGFWLLVRWRAPGFVVAYVSVVMGLPILATNPVSIPRFLLAAFPLLIPLAARIIRACNAYVAMVSERPYRAALTDDEALNELMRLAGTEFDPTVVRVLVAHIRDEHEAERAA